jgi:hypothetical protein
MKGKVKILHLSHKNGTKILNAGDPVTDSDVNNFAELVKQGKITPDAETAKQLKAMSPEAKKAAAEKAAAEKAKK